MRVLIGCETSGASREAFRRLGHDAWSCDVLPADDGSPHHIVGDIVKLLEDGPRWDLIILHPPCTALAVSGNRWYGEGKERHHERVEAIRWTVALWELATSICPRVALENPVGVLSSQGGLAATQYIQPWQFGHGETKKTGLWLHGLPALRPTDVVEGREQRVWNLPPSPDRWKIRSKTFQGIADAFASQWGGVAK